MGKKRTFSSIIEEANKVHNNYYLYKEVISKYKSKHRYLIIECPIHGIFEQRMDLHLIGHGCRKCYDENRKKTNVEFYNNVNNIYNFKYKYFNDFKDYNTKIKIECPIHGIFYKYPTHHLNGDGCCDCKLEDKFKDKQKEFIEKSNKVHNNFYNYDKVIYNGYRTNVTVTCPVHGDFLIKPLYHINGSRCKQCTIDEQCKTHEQFLIDANKVHNNFYIYNDKYISSKYKITITCPLHGDFKQLPKNHVSNKQGCPKCKRSNGELKIENILVERNIIYESEYKFDECKNITHLPFDFYLPEKNICIEYDGEQHYIPSIHFGGEKALEFRQYKDNIKNEFCKNNGIELLRIRYDDNLEEKLNNFLNERGI